MRRTYWLVNLVLLAGTIGLCWKWRVDWRAEMAQNGPQAVRPRPLALAAEPAVLAPRDYSNISQQNPFSADRNDAIATPPQAQAAGPPPLLYGSLIFGKQRFALLGTEASPKPQQIAEGATFDGYKVVTVRPESVVFETQAGISEVMLYNAVSRLRREYAKTTQTSPTPATAQSSAAATAAPAAASTVVNAPPAPAPTQTAGPLPPGPAQPGRHVMQTPFGPIWVDDQPHH